MPSSRKVQFTPEAEADLREILQYTRETWGKAQRDRYAAALNKAFSQLASYPELGPARPEYFPDCRILPLRHHVIYYRIREGGVRVIRVLHERMDAASRLSGYGDEPPQ